VSERDGRIVAIEDPDHATAPNEARSFPDDGERIIDVAEERVRNHGIKGAVRQIQLPAVTRPKFDALSQTFVCGQLGRLLSQGRSKINS